MKKLTWDIKIGRCRLAALKGVTVQASVLNLSDTAVIELPARRFGRQTEVRDNIAVGDEVTISLGYDGDNALEFSGFVKRIGREKESLKVECEDALYLLRKSVVDKEYKDVTLKALLSDVLSQVDGGLTVDVETAYDMKYDKFVTFHATALDVLKKVHDDTKADIWFEGRTLHIKPVYGKPEGDEAVTFDPLVNMQANDLKWVDSRDKNVEVEVRFRKPDGKIEKQTYGMSGGEKKIKYVEISDTKALKEAAENEYNMWNYSGYEGDFTAWLVPRVKAGGTVRLRDSERKEDARYYVTGVEIEFGQNGAKRKVKLGMKLTY